MFRNRYVLLCVAAAMFSTVFLSGCFNKSSQDNTKVAQPKQIGIVDMVKAAEGHPKYAEYKRLQQEYSALAQQLEAEARETTRTDQADLPASNTVLNGLNESLSQEFNSKFQAKQEELQGQLNELLAKARSDASQEMDTYTQEIDQIYQPQIFSLQLKIKTVQMDKEEMAVQQKQLEQLQNERQSKLSAKEQELSAHIDSLMSPQKAAAEAELAAFAQKLQAELDQKASDKASEITSRVQPAPVANDSTASLEEGQKRLALRQQDIETLHDSIEKDIRDKAAKIAAERDLEAVIVNVTVNISGVDITNDIVAAFNK